MSGLVEREALTPDREELSLTCREHGSVRWVIDTGDDISNSATFSRHAAEHAACTPGTKADHG